MTGIREYSTNADANLSVAGISLAEGMARASVNNAMRQQLADIADLLLDMGGSKVTTGTASAYLVSLDTNPTAYSDNLFFLATAHVDNANAPTINVNGIGVKPIKSITRGITAAIVASDFPAGHIGIFTYSSSKNAVILLNPAGFGAGFEFDTVADMLADTHLAQGEGTVWRADGFRYREADPAATDHHLTTAGGVKLYVQPGDDGWYNFRAMNPVMDNVSGEVTNAALLNKLLLIRPTGGQDANNQAWPQGPSIQIPMGHYYFDPGPWGFQLKATTHLRGEFCVPGGAPDSTVLHIKKDCVGFVVNSYDTYQNTIESGFGPYGKGGALGSTIERLWLISQITASGGNDNAHGLWLRTGATVLDCEIQNFNGNGINAVGNGAPDNFVPWVGGVVSVTRGHGVKTDEGNCYGCWINPGTPSTVKPTHTTPGLTDYPDGYNWYYVDPLLRGGPSHCSYQRVTCAGNRHNGILIDGGDSSATVGISVNAYGNGRSGIVDSGFLGNTWIGCHSRTNGVSGSALNSAIQSSVVSLQNGPGGTYNKYMAKWGATEASLVATMPGTDENVWVSANIGGPNVPLHPYYPVWTPGRPEGTYFVAAGYVADNNNARTMFIGCYQEGDEPYSYVSQTSLGFGGIANFQKGSLSLDAVGGVLTNQTGFSVTDTSNNFIGIATSGTSSATAYTALSFRAVSEAQPWRLQYNSTTGDWDLDYQNAFHAFNLTSINTVGKMGTSKTQPYLLHAPTLAIGGAIGGTTTVRRQTTHNVKPTTGEYAAGDVIWNASATPTNFAGWLCTSAGPAGTPAAWTTGTNYALNAFVLASNGKYYRCSVDPVSGNSTAEPSHVSGEVINLAASLWATGTDYALNAFIWASSGRYYRCTTDPGAGLSTVEPTHTSGAVTDADGYGWTVVTAWIPHNNYFLNDIVLGSNGKYYRCSVDPGTFFTSDEPTHSVGEARSLDGYGWLFLSSAWVTNTNYALNDFILTSSGRYYRCSTDPGAGLSTVQPSHLSGAVTGGDGYGWTFVSAADGYGWTFVSNAVAELLPFGQTSSQQTLTADAAFTLTPGTSPRFTRHSGTLATNRIVTLSTVGAYAGLVFRITRTGGGAGNLNVGTTLKSLATDTWCEVVFDGTVWNLSAYGTL